LGGLIVNPCSLVIDVLYADVTNFDLSVIRIDVDGLASEFSVNNVVCMEKVKAL
jgi:hypothetical protein